MPEQVDRGRVVWLMERGAVLLDVLPVEDFEDEHIAGAISLPLKTLNAATASALDRARSIVTYCHDYL